MRSTLFAAALLAALTFPALGRAASFEDGAPRLRVPELRLASLTSRGPRPPMTILPSMRGLLDESSGAADSGAGPAILYGALYGGAAGALIGLGVALIENDHYFRDIAIGAGAGLIVGGAFGAARSMRDQRPYPDNLSTLDRDPVLHGTTVPALAARF